MIKEFFAKLTGVNFGPEGEKPRNRTMEDNQIAARNAREKREEEVLKMRQEGTIPRKDFTPRAEKEERPEQPSQ